MASLHLQSLSISIVSYQSLNYDLRSRIHCELRVMAKEEKDGSNIGWGKAIWKDLTEKPEDVWKDLHEPVRSVDGATPRKRKLRPLPERYFILGPPKPLWKNILIYGSQVVAGIGCGMLIEDWMEKKIKKDGGVIYELDK